MSAPTTQVRPMRCPQCANEDVFALTLTLRVQVDGTTAVLDATDIDWDATIWATCASCGFLSEDVDFISEWEEADR